MAFSIVRIGLRSVINLERKVAVLSVASVPKQLKNLLRSCIKEFLPIIENKNTDSNTNKVKTNTWQKITERFNELNKTYRTTVEIKQQWRTAKLDAKKKDCQYRKERNGTGGGPKPPSPDPETKEIMEMIPNEFMVDSNQFDSDGIIQQLIHTKPACNGSVCYLGEPRDRELQSERSSMLRRYSKHHGRPEENRRKQHSDSDSDTDLDTQCKGYDRSEFWRRKMRTVHNILDVDKDGLISFNDFLLFAERFKSLGHLTDEQAQEFTSIIKLTWEEQWGAIDPYNFVTVEQYLEDMHHVLNDKTLKKKAYRWLPYLFKAVDKDKSGYISVHEFKLFFQCLGLDNEHAAVAFAVIDVNGDGKLSQKEFVKLGKEFFCTEDETRVSKMFWGPLNSN